MNNHFCIPKKYTDGGFVKPPEGHNVYGYVFCNTGNANCNIVPSGYTLGDFTFDQWTLEPGEFLDTRNVSGTFDVTIYKLEFQQPDVLPGGAVQANNSEMTVSIYVNV